MRQGTEQLKLKHFIFFSSFTVDIGFYILW